MSHVRVFSVLLYHHAKSRVPGPRHTRGCYQLVLDDVRTLKCITFVIIPKDVLFSFIMPVTKLEHGRQTPLPSSL